MKRHVRGEKSYFHIAIGQRNLLSEKQGNVEEEKQIDH